MRRQAHLLHSVGKKSCPHLQLCGRLLVHHGARSSATSPTSEERDGSRGSLTNAASSSAIRSSVMPEEKNPGFLMRGKEHAEGRTGTKRAGFTALHFCRKRFFYTGETEVGARKKKIVSKHPDFKCISCPPTTSYKG